VDLGCCDCKRGAGTCCLPKLEKFLKSLLVLAWLGILALIFVLFIVTCAPSVICEAHVTVSMLSFAVLASFSFIAIIWMAWMIPAVLLSCCGTHVFVGGSGDARQKKFLLIAFLTFIVVAVGQIILQARTFAFFPLWTWSPAVSFGLQLLADLIGVPVFIFVAYALAAQKSAPSPSSSPTKQPLRARSPSPANTLSASEVGSELGDLPPDSEESFSTRLKMKSLIRAEEADEEDLGEAQSAESSTMQNN